MEYFEECILLEVEPLAEAGGFISWLMRRYTGKDDSVLKDVNRGIAKIKTPEDKAEALIELDAFIVEAEQGKNGNLVHDISRGAALGLVARSRNRNLGHLDRYVDDLHALRNTVNAIEFN